MHRRDIELGIGQSPLSLTVGLVPDFPPAVPGSKTGLPRGRADPAVDVGNEDVQLVTAARHGMNRAALRHPQVPDRPPATPAGEASLPRGRPDSVVGTNDEDVEFVRTAGDDGNRRTRNRRRVVDRPPAVPASKTRLPRGRADPAVDVGNEDVQLVTAARHGMDFCCHAFPPILRTPTLAISGRWTRQSASCDEHGATEPMRTDDRGRGTRPADLATLVEELPPEGCKDSGPG